VPYLKGPQASDTPHNHTAEPCLLTLDAPMIEISQPALPSEPDSYGAYTKPFAPIPAIS
jgi:hypothetical protein